ncbi:MAG: glycosyltransferase [Dongiaceae bacterium]
MRLMHVIAGAEHGGAETYFGDLLTAFANAKNLPAGFKQYAVLRPHPPRVERVTQANIPYATLSFRGILDFTSGPKLRKLIADYQPTIVQSWMNRSTSFVPVKKNFIHVGWHGGYYNMKHYQHCDHVIVITEDMRQTVLRTGWPEDRLHLIPPFAPEDRAEPIARAEFSTPQHVPLFLALARLHVKKGLDTLLKALVKVPDAHLWIAGEGPLRKELEKLCQDLNLQNRVRFLGWRTDRAALLAACDAVVFPSRYEPFGVVTLEAWAQRRPLVAAASAGPRSVITDESDALLVPVDNVEALTQGMKRLIADKSLAARLTEAGYQTFQLKYSQKAAVQNHLNFYQAIAEQGPLIKRAA